MSKEAKPLLNFYSSALNDKYRKLAEPLDQFFKINRLFYSVSTTKGQFFQISNQPEVAEYYFSNGFHIYNPFICHPDNYSHNQVIVTGDFPDHKYQELQENVKDRFGVGSALTIYKKQADMVHIFMFTSTHASVPLSTLFLNQFSALNSFADSFLNQWQVYLPKMEPFLIDLAEQMGHRFFKPNPHLGNTTCDLAAKEKFLAQLGLINNNRNYLAKLTTREKECIEGLLKGKTANQIADLLGLSSRTVEHYLENIKIKLDCDTKPELMERLVAYRTHNLL